MVGLVISVNIVQFDAFRNVCEIKMFRDQAKGFPLAKLSTMFKPKNILVSNVAEDLNKRRTLVEVFNVIVGGYKRVASRNFMLPNYGWVVGGMDKLGDYAKLPNVDRGSSSIDVVAKIINFVDDYSGRSLKCGGLSGVNHLHINSNGFSSPRGCWTANGMLENPRSLIHPHGVTHNVKLSEIHQKHQNRNEDSGYGEPKSFRLLPCFLYIAFLVAVGMFLAKKVVAN